MLFEEASRLLQPGYTPLETGYCRLPNNQTHVAVLTQMHGCSGKMVDWWFGYLDDSEKYRFWEPTSHRKLACENPRHSGQYIGESQIVERDLGGIIRQVRIHYHAPFEIFDRSSFKESEWKTAICANVYDLDRIPIGRFIHLIRDRDFGCEVRSRFWLFQGSDIEAVSQMEHCMEEMGRLAAFLPDLYFRKNGETNDSQLRGMISGIER
ncbi:MAG: hypothetical protein ABII06_18940 [Pseudomonadota bacterium]